MEFNSVTLNDSSSIWSKQWKQITDELKQDEEVDSWILMTSPWPIIVIFLLYLQFVLKTGPAMMKDRPPFKLKRIISIYNIWQIALNATLFLSCFGTSGFASYVWKEQCTPSAPTTPEEASHLYTFLRGSWWFLIAKVFDLLDTVFFVLAKKQSHVTFLHVYHHSSMMLTVWFGFKYIRPLHTTFPAILNCVIHVIMYSYYLISIQRPGIGKKYMFAKRIVTRLQIVQFLIILGHCTTIWFCCPVPRSIIFLIAFHVTAFLFLFINFYVKQYILHGKKSEVKSSKQTKKDS